MSGAEAVDLRYPIGRFVWKGSSTAEERARWIEAIEEAPARMRAAVTGLSAEQMATPYREGGWTVAQVAHHVPDSHMNSYVRFKLALTEESPAIKPYDEARWAELADTRVTPVETSLVLLEALHGRWVALLRAMTEAEWGRSFVHPEMGAVRLDRALALYDWHGRHHVAQIAALRERMGW